MLNGLDVDMLFTGELSHHEALAAIEQGKVVVTTFHSKSERGYLSSRMKLMLDTELGNSMSDFQVDVSELDSDPFEIVGNASLQYW